MKKIKIFAAAILTMCVFSGCYNADVSSVGREQQTEDESNISITTTVTTTAVNTTTFEETSESVSQDTLSAQTTVPATTSVVTTTPEQVTTTTAATTKATEKKTSTTTKKVTTTTKKATTTAKPKPVTTTKKVTTTTKKATTTAPKTTTKKVTTTAKSNTLRITQSDVDKLVKELQAYSNSIVKERVLADIEMLKDKLPEGYNWETYLAEQYQKTPSNSSWDNVTGWMEYQDSTKLGYADYNIMLKQMKKSIDCEYQYSPDSHVVVYAEYFKSEYTGETGWDIYLLR